MSVGALLCGAAPTQIDYQGRITIRKRPFTGTGYFKYAITPSSEATNYWANDGTAVGVPATGCSQKVTEGRFSTLLGAPPMQPIAPAALSQGEACFFRVWFSQDGLSFQELTPKQTLASSPFALHAATLEGKDAAFFQNASNLVTGTISDERLGESVTRLGSSIGAGELEADTVGLAELKLEETDARYVSKIDGALQGPLRISGTLDVDGAARFEEGILFVAPVGDLRMGSYTNRP
jgi:hypothetical protein